MARKLLKHEEFSRILHEDESSDDDPIEIDDGDISEDDEDAMTLSDYETEPEQKVEPVDSSIAHSSEIFFGKDKSYQWSKTNFSTSMTIKKEDVIDMVPGPKPGAEHLTSEIAAFSKIIDNKIIDSIVHNTNLCLGAKKEYKRERDVRSTTRTEVMALLGVLYLIGTKRVTRSNIEELWSSDGTGIQILRATMSYKRFLLLLQSLQFDDKSTRLERQKVDKLAAIRDTIDVFVSKCQNSYNLGEFMTIGEKLEPFRGRCSFIQHFRDNPNKYGIKLAILSDSQTYFTFNLEVYCGQQPNGPFCVENSPSAIVTRLVAPVKGSGRNVTTDKWYTSYALAKSLLEDKITLIGMLKKNKPEIPPAFLPRKEREVDSILFGFQKDMTLVSYVPENRKTIILLSTMHDSGTIDEDTKQPNILLDYNATTALVDQTCSTYTVKRRTRRWPVVVFFSLLDIAGINAQVLFSSNKDNPVLSRRVFLKNLALGLMEPHLMERAKLNHLPRDIKAFLVKYGKPEAPTPVETSTKKRGRCATCGRAKNISTTITCSLCGAFVCKRHAKINVSCENCENVTKREIDESE